MSAVSDTEQLCDDGVEGLPLSLNVMRSERRQCNGRVRGEEPRDICKSAVSDKRNPPLSTNLRQILPYG